MTVVGFSYTPDHTPMADDQDTADVLESAIASIEQTPEAIEAGHENHVEPAEGAVGVPGTEEAR